MSLASPSCSPPAQVRLSGTDLATHDHDQAPQVQGLPPPPPRPEAQCYRRILHLAVTPLTPTSPGQASATETGDDTASHANSILLPLAEHLFSHYLFDSHPWKPVL